MNNLTRELHIQKWFFLVGLPLGLIMPLWEGLWSLRHGYTHTFHTDVGGGVAAIAGPAFAVLLAAACSWQDLCGRRDRFWLSRPVSPGRLLTIRLLLAMGLLTACLTLIVAPDMISRLIRPKPDWQLFSWTLLWLSVPTSAMLFAFTQWMMALTRDVTRSVLAGLWFGLMTLFIPLMLNGPAWTNYLVILATRDNAPDPGLVGNLVLRMMRDSAAQNVPEMQLTKSLGEFLIYVGLLILLTAVFHLLAVRAVASGRRVKLNFKTLVWTVGGSLMAILLIFLAQVGNNLRPQRRVALNNRPETAALREELSNGRDCRVTTDPLAGTQDETQNVLVTLTLTYAEEKGAQSHYSTHRETPVNTALTLNCYTPRPEPIRQGPVPRQSSDPVGELRLQREDEIPYGDVYGTILCLHAEKGRATIVRHARCARNAPMDERRTIVEVVDIADPTRPMLLGRLEMHYAWSAAVIADHLYLLSPIAVDIIPLADPATLQVARRIELPLAEEQHRRRELAPQLLAEAKALGKSNRWVLDELQRRTQLPAPARPALGSRLDGGLLQGLPTRFTAVHNRRLLLSDGAWTVGLAMDDPLNPRVFYQRTATDESFAGQPTEDRAMALAMDDKAFYLSTRLGILSVELLTDAEGNCVTGRVGWRRATVLERMVGRYVNSLFMLDGRLVEYCDAFGLLVYDVSDPARPRRRFHYDRGWIQPPGPLPWGNEMLLPRRLDALLLRLPQDKTMAAARAQ